MPRSANRIDLKTQGEKFEGRAGGAVTPGQIVKLDADGDYTVETGDGAETVEVVVALEDSLQGRTVDDPYADQEVLFLITPVKGDILNVRLAASQTIVKGDKLYVNDAGRLEKYVDQATAHFTAMEAVTSGVGVTPLIAARMI